MEWIVNYWPLLTALVAILAVIIFAIYKFTKQPRPEQLAKVREWLLYAVTAAEKEFGSGTGQIKLRYVYDKFITKFPYLTTVISFELFSNLVDEALVKFKEILETNNKIQKYVENNAVAFVPESVYETFSFEEK